ncbi:MAG: hypothetical protein KDJ76_15055 [Xanthobacteraceae bacterium]|nr:hypothetical protein [Xanthobacteraceae bacterium]
MPRYFFNTRVGNELLLDPEGEDLRDPDHAWEVARAMIRELVQSEASNADLFRAVLEVSDGDGEVVFEMPFNEAVLDPPARSAGRMH